MSAAVPGTAALWRLDDLAADVGRLRRRFASNADAWTGAYVADRLADHVESLVLMLEPTAAEIAGVWAPGDEGAIAEAIRIVDRHVEELRRRLGGRP